MWAFTDKRTNLQNSLHLVKKGEKKHGVWVPNYDSAEVLSEVLSELLHA